MCGIAGAISWDRPPDELLVSAMTRALAHRGPDAEGIESDGPICFGHRRLAVIDLSNDGLQPKWNRNRRILITFNGEIYNFRELRKELEGRGVNFTTHTDTEVIL